MPVPINRPYALGDMVTINTTSPNGGLAGVIPYTEAGKIIEVNLGSDFFRVDFPHCHHWGGYRRELTRVNQSHYLDMAYDLLFRFLEDMLEDNNHKLVRKLLNKRDINLLTKYASEVMSIRGTQ